MKLVDVVESLVCDRKITNTDMADTIIYLINSLGSTQAIKKVKNYIDETADYELHRSYK
jgi:hypothetical protein